MLKMLIIAMIGYGYISYKIYSLYLSKFPPYIVMPVALLIMFSFIIIRVIGFKLGLSVPPTFLALSYAIMGLSVIFLMLFIATDILSIFKIKSIFSFQIKYAILILGFLIYAYGYYNQLTPVITKYDVITDKKLDKELKIIFVSDIHIDNIMSDRKLERYVDKINKIDADIVLIGGDIIDNDLNDLTPEKIAILSKLNKPSYAVLGNHDYYTGRVDELIKVVNETGIRMLRDNVIIFNGINIIGRDTRAHSINGMNVDNRKPMSIFNNINSDNYTIVIEHIPDVTSIEENKGFGSDMMLSGHTHGGQFFPVTLIVKLFYENSYGLKRFDNLTTIVSSGIDLWGARMRLGSVSEIVLINLKNR